MIRILQINLNGSLPAHLEMKRKVETGEYDICVISEPNVKASRNDTKRDQGWIADEDHRAVIWWTGRNRGFRVERMGKERGLAWTTLTGGVLITSSYCSPSHNIDEFHDHVDNEGVI